MKKTSIIKLITAAMAASVLLTGCSDIEDIIDDIDEELEELEEDAEEEIEDEEDDLDEDEYEDDDDEDEEDEEVTGTTVITPDPSRDDAVPDKPAPGGAYSGTEFSTVDVYGKSVGTEIFSENTVTVVNCWGTYCGPCIDEMPELEEWYEEEQAAGRGVMIIGLPIDVDSGTAYMATDVMNDTGVTYPNLIIDSGLYEMFCKDLYCVPTTFIVDSSGNIVAGPFEGAYVQGYKDAVEDYLDSIG